MFLCDDDIIWFGEKIIKPFHKDRVQPASYDLSLDSDLLIPLPFDKAEGMDLRVDCPSEYMEKYSMGEKGHYTLHPGNCVLGCTEETINCFPSMCIDVVGKSSYARMFLIPHLQAGWCDAGFNGQVTLEIKNSGPWPIKLYKGMRIAQAKVSIMNKDASRPYGSKDLGSHYQRQKGPTPTKGKRGK